MTRVSYTKCDGCSEKLDDWASNYTEVYLANQNLAPAGIFHYCHNKCRTLMLERLEKGTNDSGISEIKVRINRAPKA